MVEYEVFGVVEDGEEFVVCIFGCVVFLFGEDEDFDESEVEVEGVVDDE